MTRRTFVDADVEVLGKPGSDPIQQFFHALRLKHGGTEETEIKNAQLLSNLLGNGHLSKGNIVWKTENVISRIYGIKMNNDGKISYGNDAPPSPEKKKKSFITDATPIDFGLLKNVAIRAHAGGF